MNFFKLLKTLNIFISIVVAVLAVYIILLPFLPNIVFAMSTNKFEGYAYQSEKTIQVLGEKAKELPLVPKDNRLVIPRIYVNAVINEGEDTATLLRGVWRMPNTSTPDKGGNTVIGGHRYKYTNGPNTFFQLDKIANDDTVLVYWQGKEYVYKVYEIIEVSPAQVEIVNNTKDPIITLYTCTPLWTSERRLVVKAALER